MLTWDECFRILSKLGFKYGVSPNIISEKLLSDEDKSDMMRSELPLIALEVAIEIWVKAGKPDYANGIS